MSVAGLGYASLFMGALAGIESCKADSPRGNPPQTKPTMLISMPTLPNIWVLLGGIPGNFTLFGIGGLLRETALLKS